jgi:hypothetical protein
MTGTSPAYDLWTEGYSGFLALTSAERLPDADPNGDGIVNLFAYATGLDPLVNQLAGAIAGIDSPDPSRIIFRFRRNRMAPDLTFEVLVSSDPAENHWTVLSLAGATTTSIQGNPGVEEVSVPLFLGEGESRKFARLRVTQSPPSGP